MIAGVAIVGFALSRVVKAGVAASPATSAPEMPKEGEF
jgi:hypothetical protein